MIKGYDQHDSQELLQYALEGVHTELNRAPPKKKPKAKPEDNNNNNNKEVDDVMRRACALCAYIGSA
jgi:ubiquitin C-terminal hydrolase